MDQINLSPIDIKKDIDNNLVSYRYTQNSDGTAVFSIILTWPRNSLLVLGNVFATKKSKVTLKGYDKPLIVSLKSYDYCYTKSKISISKVIFYNSFQFKTTNEGTQIAFPEMHLVKGKWAFVVKMTNVTPII